MQTFLPYSSFELSARCLDYRRLGKQRVEAWQIYQTLIGKSHGWQFHPIVKMWKGYEVCLLCYGIKICEEWKERGYIDNLMRLFLKELDRLVFKEHRVKLDPYWLGNEKFHASHRSNLLRKNKEYYSKFGWKEPDNLPYYWEQTKK